MKRYTFKINGQKYQVEINECDGSNAKVTVNGNDYEVEIQGDEQKPKTTPIIRKPATTAPILKTAAPKPAVSSSSTGHKIESPLPGTIKKVNIAVGDTVKEGDCLMVMEAMKMDNNILCDKGGVIKTVKVREGDAVLQGEILVEIA